MVFANSAPAYWKSGYSPLPIVLGDKRPAIPRWQIYCHGKAPDATFEDWVHQYANLGLGLALGIEMTEGLRLLAVDVDSEDMVERVQKAIGATAPAKVGKKGVTFFLLAAATVVNTKIKRKDSQGRPESKPSVEILAAGSQTVIPPTIHPHTNEPYRWLGPGLLDTQTFDIPLFTEATLDEITAHCHGKGEHFDAINEMTWLGEGGGGNTHDTCVAAVACMVARGWNDIHIVKRIERAKREACHRAREKYDWPEAGTRIQEWIDSCRSKGMEDRVPTKKLPPERVMADWAYKKLGGPGNVACVRGQLRYYHEGHWPEASISGLLREMYEFDELLKEREAKAAVSILHTVTENNDFGRTPDVEPKDDPKRQRICLLNGTLNLRTGSLEQWSNEHETIHRLSFDWDDEAECSVYDRVVKETFDGDEDAINLWDEFSALTLVDDMSFQKLLFLKGPGGNGKGTLARVLRNMHNPSAVGSVAITDLNDERKRTSLLGKLVNISGEQSRLNVVADTYLKKITGGDPVDVRRLYGEVQNNVGLSVRFLELVNEMPATADYTEALRRRIIILTCPNKVANPDLNLDKKLYEERPGILRRWLKALQRLYQRGQFLIPDTSVKSVDEYMLENDSIRYWISDRCEEMAEGDGTPSRDLYADFREWEKNMGYRWATAEVYWGRRLTNLGYPSFNRRVGRGFVRSRRLKVRLGSV